MPPKKRSSSTVGTSITATSETAPKRASVRVSIGAKPADVARHRANELYQRLERDNLNEEPNKGKTPKTPNFGLTENKIKPSSRASKRVLGATQGRYRKTLEQKRQEMLMKDSREGLVYDILTSPLPISETNVFCENCIHFAKERCSTCYAFICQKRCLETHRDLKCNKTVR